MNKVAEIFAPGDFLAEELDARGWTQIELADIIGRPTTLVNGIIKGKKQITPDTAIQLGDALGTGPELWMNLESQYQLSKVKEVNNSVIRKAKLYERFPVRDMIKRGWIENAKNIDILEQQFMKFFDIESLDEKLVFCHSAKKTNPLKELSGQQLAWLYRVKILASAQLTKNYEKNKLLAAIPKLNALLTAPEEARHVSKILFECGVKYVIVEPFSGSKIDGACFWLNDTQPVIGMTLRLDRIDNFWFVLRHEIEHILQEHGKNDGFILDIDSDTPDFESILEEESVANLAAAEFCVPQAELENFYNRVFPLFSEQKIKLFSQRIGVHIGIVVGQLQRRLKRYDFLRTHQVKIRSYAISGALTDGWGCIETN